MFQGVRQKLCMMQWGQCSRLASNKLFNLLMLGSTPSVDQGRRYHQNHHAMEPFMHSLICDMICYFAVGSTWLAGMRSLQKACFSPTNSWNTCTTAFKEISPNCKGNLVWNWRSRPSTWHNHHHYDSYLLWWGKCPSPPGLRTSSFLIAWMWSKIVSTWWVLGAGLLKGLRPLWVSWALVRQGGWISTKTNGASACHVSIKTLCAMLVMSPQQGGQHGLDPVGKSHVSGNQGLYSWSQT